MFRWQSWKLWLVLFIICVFLGIAIGVISSKKRTKPPTLLSGLSSESCRQLLDRPININFAIEGLLMEKEGSNVLLKFNEKESMWISLREDHKIVDNRNNPGTAIALEDVAIGSTVMVKGLGMTDRLENLVYADKLEVN